MDNKKIDEMYWKVKYIQKLINNIEDKNLELIENDVYNNLSDNKKIEFELNNLWLNKIETGDAALAFKRISENIKNMIEDEKNNNVDHTSEIKKQITLLQVLLKKQVGFYKSALDINKDYIEKSLRR